jgi:hypothetical protein
MVSLNIISLCWDFPIEWNETLTLSLILFSAGLLCIISAILLAIYLLKSDRFTTPSPKETLPSPKRFKTESRFSHFKEKLRSFFKREDLELDIALDDLKLKGPSEPPPKPPEDEQSPSD